MRLIHLLREAGLPTSGVADGEISGITADSRQVRPGMMFVAIVGFTHDGHTFVPDAVSRGAAAVVVERDVLVPEGVPRIAVPNSRETLGHLGSAFYGHPSRELSVLGITGTNGKGTTAYLIEAILSGAGRPCGIIGTMGAKMGEATIDLERTTPEAPELQRLLREMADRRIRYVAVEVASHALALHRVTGMRFAAAVFTNLTQDHLDFHKTFDAYLAAKRRLFEMVEPDGVAIINADDPAGAAMARASRAQTVTYGITSGADVRASDVRLHLGGTEFRIVTPRGHAALLRSRLHGRFNVYNTLAAIAVAQWAGVTLDELAPALQSFSGVPGRFEAVDEGQPFGVVVDYAHTPDGLANVLQTAKDFVRGRTIVVFGCGGDRDRTKRPIMGRLAAELADMAIVTSDNPRTEEPGAIIEEILAGIRDRDGAQIEVEPDRRKAIYKAIGLARPGDMVIIAGKGHEPYQEIKGVKHPFDDRVVAREALRQVRTPSPGHRAPS
ncbi:MAG: UDP-N-acetylmuramoyl-L-alanyl-D-glutamate--2,6-diaminopimelate ligase [Armatimonadetes bacterium]|nr:UDP-N-acetylmuramoyl-L-alanyl-D-glutamate--2,6-diaminopimelate ligase [Armatimonadota bacterium]